MAHKADTEMRLRMLKQGITNLPQGCAVETWLLHRGHPPESAINAPAEKTPYTLADLRQNYLGSAAAKRLEPNSFRVAGYHFQHLTRIFGARQVVSLLEYRDLQRYVDKRSTERPPSRLKNPPPSQSISPVTIRLEIKTLRTAWNWARRMDGLKEDFPGRNLVYSKTIEPLPFMTLAEAANLRAAGQAPPNLYDCIYLHAAEIDELLTHVRQKDLPPWVWPMFVFAAHTGARRSEMLRALCCDLKLGSGTGEQMGTVSLREKKCDVTRVTTRNVPLTALLREAILPLLFQQGYLFRSSHNNPIKPRIAQDYFHVALRDSPWRLLHGWHVFRHSFISSLAIEGVDQRIIDDLVGHSTEEQRRRYRHLCPNVKQQVVGRIFAPRQKNDQAIG